MKENRTTESVRIETGVLNLARQAKEFTGIPIATFIEKAIFKEFHKLPKSIREKIKEQEDAAVAKYIKGHTV